MNEFYLTLFSNSAIDIYPSNTTSSFIVNLPQKIILSEGAVVGLAEIQFPYNLFNVTENNNTFSLVHGDFAYDGSIATGFYNSQKDIVEEVLKETKDHFGDWITIDERTNRTKVIKTDKYKSPHPKSITKFQSGRLSFHGRLATQLGFAPDENVFEYENSPYVGNSYFGISEQMLVYCDLIEPQMFGFEKSQVIKVVNTTEKEIKFGTPCYRGYQKIHYIPLLRKEFETIEINIRDITGGFFPFLHGIVMVKLHFKQKLRNE